MSSVVDHYNNLLAPNYLWMVGGAEAAFATGQADLAPVVRPGHLAIDLGAGFGMHTIPLVRAGWRVLAVDTSAELLRQLEGFADALTVEGPVSREAATRDSADEAARVGQGTVERPSAERPSVEARRGDLLHFADFLPAGQRADLILCMGDTLTHLPSVDAVGQLARRVAEHLAPNGRFVATFRDYTHLPSGDARFIPVRADDHRVLTCFLEEDEGFVRVHDLLHERASGVWTTTVSSYCKLRLSPDGVRQSFESAGLRATMEPGPRGMVRLVADV